MTAPLFTSSSSRPAEALESIARDIIIAYMNAPSVKTLEKGDCVWNAIKYLEARWERDLHPDGGTVVAFPADPGHVTPLGEKLLRGTPLTPEQMDAEVAAQKTP